MTALFIPSLEPFVSPAAVSVFLFFISILFSSSLSDVFWIYNFEALESNSACLIGSLLPLLLIDGFGKSRCCTPTHSDAFGKMEVFRAAYPVFVPTLLSGPLVVSDDFSFIVGFVVEIFYVDRCWVLVIWVRSGLDWVILRLCGVDLIDLGRFLAIGASFPVGGASFSSWCGGRFGGGDGWRLFLSPACIITS